MMEAFGTNEKDKEVCVVYQDDDQKVKINYHRKDVKHGIFTDYLWYNETRFDLELSLTDIFFRGFLTLEKFERGFLTLEKFERGFLTLEKFDLEKFDLEKFELEKFDLEKFELEFPVPGKFEHVPGKFEHVKKTISTGKLRYGNFDMKSYGIFLNISNF